MKPTLVHKTQFQEILKDYEPSSDYASTLNAVGVTLLVGPSSAGRNRIIKELLKTGKYHQIISDTTRPPRSNDGVMEQDGREYWFRNEEDFLDDLHHGKFLEAAIIHEQQVSGVSIRELEKAFADGKIAINDIEVAGARYAKERLNNAKLIFILPPDFTTWMDRLAGRGVMSEEEKRARLQTAINEINRMEREINDYHVVVNDDLDAALAAVRSISENDTRAIYEDSHEQRIAKQLIQDIQSYLG